MRTRPTTNPNERRLEENAVLRRLPAARPARAARARVPPGRSGPSSSREPVRVFVLGPAGRRSVVRPSGRAPGWRVIPGAGPIPLRVGPALPEETVMFSVAHELKASYAFVERNFFLTRRYWGWEIAFLVYSVAGALSISLIGADQGNPELLL